jgi:hypothetical protein
VTKSFVLGFLAVPADSVAVTTIRRMAECPQQRLFAHDRSVRCLLPKSQGERSEMKLPLPEDAAAIDHVRQ